MLSVEATTVLPTGLRVLWLMIRETLGPVCASLVLGHDDDTKAAQTVVV